VMPKVYARHPAGYLVTFDDVQRDKLDEAIAWLQQRGYRPSLPGDGWQRTPDGEPICPKHGVAMPTRERQGDTWHSHRIIHPETGEELYCRGYSNPTSKADGYDVPGSAP
jgi:hypothetical protein